MGFLNGIERLVLYLILRDPHYSLLFARARLYSLTTRHFLDCFNRRLPSEPAGALLDCYLHFVVVIVGGLGLYTQLLLHF
jgi:hypothetical protein